MISSCKYFLAGFCAGGAKIEDSIRISNDTRFGKTFKNNYFTKNLCNVSKTPCLHYQANKKTERQM